MAILEFNHTPKVDTVPMRYAQSKRIRPTLNARQRIMKRLFDITVSSIVLFLALPVMVMVSIAIMIYDPGPILFKQSRVGEGGKLFKIYKFRSMIINADAMLEKYAIKDENGNMIHKHKDDKRVTPIGRLIRKTSLDELPQLVNVIKGDMSLVGPRPELPKIVTGYENWQYARFSVPQGITGWWQVTGRSEKPCHLNTDADVHYIKQYSLLMDIKIMLMTVPALLKGKGAF